MTRYTINNKAQHKIDMLIPTYLRKSFLQMLGGIIVEPQNLQDCLEILVNSFSSDLKYTALTGYKPGIDLLVKLDVLKKVADDEAK